MIWSQYDSLLNWFKGTVVHKPLQSKPSYSIPASSLPFIHHADSVVLTLYTGAGISGRHGSSCRGDRWHGGGGLGLGHGEMSHIWIWGREENRQLMRFWWGKAYQHETDRQWLDCMIDCSFNLLRMGVWISNVTTCHRGMWNRGIKTSCYSSWQSGMTSGYVIMNMVWLCVCVYVWLDDCICIVCPECTVAVMI